MVDRTEINEMAKFMLATNGLADTDFSPSAPLPSIHIAPPAISGVSSGSLNEMKSILSKFHDATDNVLTEASFDQPLCESLMTKATPTGARIGNWEIIVKETDKRKLYSIVHAATKQPIASDLLVYEAARYLVKYLNEGKFINSPEILDLLQTEQSYAGAIHDMKLYKHHLTKHPNSPKKAIYEDRYSQAKRKAIATREKIEKLTVGL